MDEHNLITREFLVREYEGLGKTYAEIAKELGVSTALVQHWGKHYGIKTRRIGRRKSDLKGRKFGSLTVLEASEGTDKAHPAWCCLCECGRTTTTCASSLLSGKVRNCSACGHKRGGAQLWKGAGEISGQFWSSQVIPILMEHDL